MIEIDLAEGRQLAIGRDQSANILEFKLLDDVGDPNLAEVLPSENIDAARSEQRPQRHLDSAGVRGWHDRHEIVAWKLEQLARAIDGEREPCLGIGLAVIAPEQRAFEAGEGPVGMLGAWSRREARIFWPEVWFRRSSHSSCLLSSRESENPIINFVRCLLPGVTGLPGQARQS
jgi:hypothetical protein